MQEFAYEALLPSGTVAQGVMSAENEEALEATLRLMGNYLIRAEPIASAPRAETRTDGKLPHADLLAFIEYLWASTEAGLPVLATLEDVQPQLQSKKMRRIVRELHDSVREDGRSISEALTEHPKAFSPLLVGTVAAGEASGRLDFALGQLVEQLEWQSEIQAQARQATFYPLMLLAGMVGLVLLLLGYVYPRLLPIFTNFDIELPLPTRVLMGASQLFLARWSWLLGGIVACWILFRAIGHTARGRLTIDRMKLRMPIFGKLFTAVEMARFVTYLGLFYRTGIDLLHALQILQQIVSNQAVVRAVGEARESVAAGDSLAAAFTATGLFPPIVLRVLSLGEATGRLDESLARAKSYYDREVPAAVNRMLTALQPLLIVGLGGLLLLVVLSIFLPILNIYNNLGGA